MRNFSGSVGCSQQPIQEYARLNLQRKKKCPQRREIFCPGDANWVAFLLLLPRFDIIFTIWNDNKEFSITSSWIAWFILIIIPVYASFFLIYEEGHLSLHPRDQFPQFFGWFNKRLSTNEDWNYETDNFTLRPHFAERVYSNNLYTVSSWYRSKQTPLPTQSMNYLNLTDKFPVPQSCNILTWHSRNAENVGPYYGGGPFLQSKASRWESSLWDVHHTQCFNLCLHHHHCPPNSG